MSDLMDWLALQSLSDLARFANRPPEELRQVIVTSAMTEAAMEYIYSLYDPLMSTHLLEEVSGLWLFFSRGIWNVQGCQPYLLQVLLNNGHDTRNRFLGKLCRNNSDNSSSQAKYLVKAECDVA